MAISDLILKAKVNMALIRDPRVGVFDIGVTADNGQVTLTGDVDTEQECRAAEAIARRVEGVSRVQNELTCGVGQKADSAELVTQRFLERLEEAWENLADKNALAQADYMRWALWMIYKFHLPDEMRNEEGAQKEAETIEQAFHQVSGYVGVPKALLALEMLRQAEQVAERPRQAAPDTENAQLVATPIS
ncbi:MAG TPA: BON domain-containing protein [Chthonomonadaceae bacterium]|nr:BON domain-containing protein [Chthonomonadaceae bacterium]